jgi:hypothetical protein
MTFTVATAAANASGFPPKVVVSRKGFSMYFFQMAPLPQQAATGMTPPPMALPMAIKSGTTPDHSEANHLPLRPMPLCTSSKMRHAPNSSHSARAACRYSSEAT